MPKLWNLISVDCVNTIVDNFSHGVGDVAVALMTSGTWIMFWATCSLLWCVGERWVALWPCRMRSLLWSFNGRRWSVAKSEKPKRKEGDVRGNLIENLLWRFMLIQPYHLPADDNKRQPKWMPQEKKIWQSWVQRKLSFCKKAKLKCTTS